MEAKIMGIMRPMIEDNFTDKSSGEVVDYKQLQIESEDEKGRIEIDKVSLPKLQWDMVEDLKKLIGEIVTIPCSITRNQGGGMRTVLSGVVKKLQSVASVKTA